jgi:hypothetical protein
LPQCKVGQRHKPGPKSFTKRVAVPTDRAILKHPMTPPQSDPVPQHFLGTG